MSQKSESSDGFSSDENDFLTNFTPPNGASNKGLKSAADVKKQLDFYKEDEDIGSFGEDEEEKKPFPITKATQTTTNQPKFDVSKFKDSESDSFEVKEEEKKPNAQSLSNNQISTKPKSNVTDFKESEGSDDSDFDELDDNFLANRSTSKNIILPGYGFSSKQTGSGAKMITMEEFEKNQPKPTTPKQTGSGAKMITLEEFEKSQPKPTTPSPKAPTASSKMVTINSPKMGTINSPKTGTINPPKIDFEPSEFDQSYFEAMARTWGEGSSRFYSEIRFLEVLLDQKQKQTLHLIQDIDSRIEMRKDINRKTLNYQKKLKDLEEKRADVQIVERQTVKLEIFKPPNMFNVIIMVAIFFFLGVEYYVREYDRAFMMHNPAMFAT